MLFDAQQEGGGGEKESEKKCVGNCVGGARRSKGEATLERMRFVRLTRGGWNESSVRKRRR